MESRWEPLEIGCHYRLEENAQRQLNAAVGTLHRATRCGAIALSLLFVACELSLMITPFRDRDAPVKSWGVNFRGPAGRHLKFLRK